jgi:hypothetical protein
MGFIVEQLFATKSRNPILPERAEDFVFADVSELVATQRARDAPSQKLTSRDRRRYGATKAAARTNLHWPRRDEPER